MKVNLGCGQDIKDGWENYDMYPVNDYVTYIDLHRPLPFPDNSIDEILLSHVLEHLVYKTEFMLEIARVLKPQGVVTIRLPCFSPTLDHKTMMHHGMDYFRIICDNTRPVGDDIGIVRPFIYEKRKYQDGSLRRFIMNLVTLFKCLWFNESEHILVKKNKDDKV